MLRILTLLVCPKQLECTTVLCSASDSPRRQCHCTKMPLMVSQANLTLQFFSLAPVSPTGQFQSLEQSFETADFSCMSWAMYLLGQHSTQHHHHHLELAEQLECWFAVVLLRDWAVLSMILKEDLLVPLQNLKSSNGQTLKSDELVKTQINSVK